MKDSIFYDFEDSSVRRNLLGRIIENEDTAEIITSFNRVDILDLDLENNYGNYTQWNNLPRKHIWKANGKYTAEYLSKNFIFKDNFLE